MGIGRFASLAAAAVTLLAGLIPAAPAAAQVRIGLAAPLTGPDAAFGQGMRLGAELAVAEINRAGGILGQRALLVVHDDAGDAKQGAAVARRFAGAGVTLVVGHLGSGVTAAAVPIYEEAGIVAVTPGAAWSGLTARGAGTVFRLCGSDAQQGTLAGTWLAGRGRDRPVAILNDKTSFGRGLADAAARAMRAGGVREAVFEGFSRGERDLAGIVARLKAARVAAVYFGGTAADAAALIRAMREAGLSAPLVGSDGLLDREFAAAAGPGAEGTLMTLAPDPRRLPEPKTAAARPPRPPETDALAGPAYAAVEVLRQGVEGAKSTDGRRVAAFLHAGRPMRTWIGEVAFDANGDLARPPFVLQVWRRTPEGRIDYAGNDAPP